MENFSVKNAVAVIIPTLLTYLSFFNDFKFIIEMETWRPIIAAIIVCLIMIYIVYRENQKEKLLNAILANIEKQKITLRFFAYTP